MDIVNWNEYRSFQVSVPPTILMVVDNFIAGFSGALMEGGVTGVRRRPPQGAAQNWMVFCCGCLGGVGVRCLDLPTDFRNVF